MPVDRMADAAVLRMVLRQPLGILPVVDGGVLVGVITVAGIAEHLIDDGDPRGRRHLVAHRGAPACAESSLTAQPRGQTI